MTKLILITATTKTNENEIDDIVGLYPDDWDFTSKESALFSIVDVIESPVVIEAKTPKVKNLKKSKTLEWTEDEPENKDVWEDSGGTLREIKIRPKYPLRYENGGIKETYSRHPENLETVISIEPVVVTEKI